MTHAAQATQGRARQAPDRPKDSKDAKDNDSDPVDQAVQQAAAVGAAAGAAASASAGNVSLDKIRQEIATAIATASEKAFRLIDHKLWELSQKIDKVENDHEALVGQAFRREERRDRSENELRENFRALMERLDKSTAQPASPAVPTQPVARPDFAAATTTTTAAPVAATTTTTTASPAVDPTRPATMADLDAMAERLAERITAAISTPAEKPMKPTPGNIERNGFQAAGAKAREYGAKCVGGLGIGSLFFGASRIRKLAEFDVDDVTAVQAIVKGVLPTEVENETMMGFQAHERACRRMTASVPSLVGGVSAACATYKAATSGGAMGVALGTSFTPLVGALAGGVVGLAVGTLIFGVIRSMQWRVVAKEAIAADTIRALCLRALMEDRQIQKAGAAKATG